jgi:mannose/fructose/N-acetylgalactosamine-specific phosphotransferase system component IIB
MIVFVRIDDRLIHGQVVEGWVNFLKATRSWSPTTGGVERLQRSIMEISAPRSRGTYRYGGGRLRQAAYARARQ